jgi:hypothetical protein
LAARDFAFAASFCYANITPAALHRGDLDDRGRESAEAAGHNPKFQLSDPGRHREPDCAGRANALAGIKLSSACPMPEPFKQAWDA